MSATSTVQAEPSLEESRAIQAFWDHHYDELLAQYPEQFVAVKDEKVVAADADLARLVYKLRDLNLDPRTDVAIEYISSESSKLIL